jgi:hypothetical protein
VFDFPIAKFDACLNLTLTVALTAFAGVDVIKVDTAERPMVAITAKSAVRFNMAISQVPTSGFYTFVEAADAQVHEC